MWESVNVNRRENSRSPAERNVKVEVSSEFLFEVFYCPVVIKSDWWGSRGSEPRLVSFGLVVALENFQSSFHHVWLSSLYLLPFIRVEARYREVKEFNCGKEGAAIFSGETQIHW